MGTLIKHEWQKLFQWKFLSILILLLLLLNGLLLLQQITMDSAESQRTQEWTEKEALPVSYEEFLENIDMQAEAMRETVVFQRDRFNRRNIEKTSEIYSRLHGIKIERDYPSGMRYVTDYHLTDVFLLLCVVALLTRLVLQERSEGLLRLLKPTKNGRAALICAKYLTLTGSVILLAILFYGTNYSVVASMDLLGKGDAAIQSLDGYLASPFAISIHVYLILFFLCKGMAVMAVGGVFFLLCICCRNQVYAILCIVAVFAGELLLWMTIEDYSWLSPIRQLNLAAVMDTSHYFNDYINFNFFGMPVSAVMAGLLTVFFSVGVSLLLSVKVFSSEASVEAKKNQWSHPFRRKKAAPGISSSLLCGECKKLFLMRRGLLLLILLLLVQVVSYWGNPFFSDEEEAYYHSYSQILTGKVSDEKTEWIKGEEERFEELSEELERQYQRYEKGEISSAVLDYYISELTPRQAEINGFKRAKEQYGYLQEQSAKGENVAYLYQTGWNQLLGREGWRGEVLDFIKLFLTVLLALSGLGTMEKESYVEILIIPSAKGIKSVNRVKAVLCAVYGMIAAGITFMWRPLQIAGYYTLSGFNYSIRSLTLFSEMGYSVSIKSYLIIICLLKILVAVFAGEFVLYLSRKCRQDSTALLLGSALFFVPLAAIWFFCGF